MNPFSLKRIALAVGLALLAASASPARAQYKALVCIFIDGQTHIDLKPRYLHAMGYDRARKALVGAVSVAKAVTARKVQVKLGVKNLRGALRITLRSPAGQEVTLQNRGDFAYGTLKYGTNTRGAWTLQIGGWQGGFILESVTINFS